MTQRHPPPPPRRSDASRSGTVADPEPPDPSEPTTAPELPSLLPRGTTELAPDAVTGAPRRARGTPSKTVEPVRALVLAPERARAGWIEGELANAPVTIQMARRVRTAIAALTKDPPPRPELLIVDFDAVSPAELLELHAIRHDGWTGRLIGVGRVPDALRASLVIESVLSEPLVRDSLLDCVAGTRHATSTVPIPMFQAIALFGLTGRREK